MQAVLRNEFFTLTVDTLGAEAVSLKNAAGEEVLWQADPEVWPRHAPILFPWTGELPQLLLSQGQNLSCGQAGLCPGCGAHIGAGG